MKSVQIRSYFWSELFLSVFSPNAGKHGPEITPYLDTFLAVNSKLWTLTETLEQSISSFQRKSLKTTCLSIKWPNTMRNGNVHSYTKVKLWLRVIGEKQLPWFCHLIRLPDDTQAKIARNYVLELETKPSETDME